MVLRSFPDLLTTEGPLGQLNPGSGRFLLSNFQENQGQPIAIL